MVSDFRVNLGFILPSPVNYLHISKFFVKKNIKDILFFVILPTGLLL